MDVSHGFNPKIAVSCVRIGHFPILETPKGLAGVFTFFAIGCSDPARFAGTGINKRR